VALDDALAKLRRTRNAEWPYPQWAASVGNAGVSAGVTMLFTASPKIIAVTSLARLVTDQLLRWLQVP
jgi:hypothetical protein